MQCLCLCLCSMPNPVKIHPPLNDISEGLARETYTPKWAPTWKVADVFKAACLLHTPPLSVDLLTEHEKRTVYSLIYDVFRYKNVLELVLKNAGYYFLYPEFKTSSHIVRLLLYDLHMRRYHERSRRETRNSRAFFMTTAFSPSLDVIETSLWLLRTRIAAGIARLRIARNALYLSDLLPVHLRDSCRARASVNAWVNKNRVTQPLDVIIELNATFGMQPLNTQEGECCLTPDRYAWDALCPMFLCFHVAVRRALATSKAALQHRIILQHRSFCYGSAMFCKVLYEMRLRGTVLLTHASSPRTLAYMASLVSQNERIFSVLAFGAGDRKSEFEEYLQLLGVDNVLVYAKRLIDMDPDAEIFDNVVAVLAAPPNSCSAVADPVDMVCERGADLITLELLTDSEESVEGQARVKHALEEQRETLAFVMARSHVQFILYETHSRLESENELMVHSAVCSANRMAHRRHAAQLAGLELKAEDKYKIKDDNKTESNGNDKDESKKIDDGSCNREEYNCSDECGDPCVPATEEFETAPLPDLCFNSNSGVRLREEGCYLALLQRKQITCFESNEEIRMVELTAKSGKNCVPSKGASVSSAASRKSQKALTRLEKAKVAVRLNRRHHKNIVNERITAQTHSSMMRSYDPNKCGCHGMVQCPRHCVQETNSNTVGTTPARHWWDETTKYLTKLKKSLVRRSEQRENKEITLQGGLVVPSEEHERLLEDIHNIDEILSRVPKVAHTRMYVPQQPSLHLSRHAMRQERIPFPVFNCSVELPEKNYY